MSLFGPGVGDFTFWRNGPTHISFRVTDLTTGDPIDLTGQRLWMQWRDYEGAATVRLEISTDDDVGDRIAIDDAEDGVASIILTEATKDALPWPLIGPDNRPTIFAHDLRMGPPGSEAVLFGGNIYLKTGTTRDAG